MGRIHITSREWDILVDLQERKRICGIEDYLRSLSRSVEGKYRYWIALKDPRTIEDEDPYAWEAVLYKGILYAQTVLDLDRPVVVKVEP